MLSASYPRCREQVGPGASTCCVRTGASSLPSLMREHNSRDSRDLHERTCMQCRALRFGWLVLLSRRYRAMASMRSFGWVWGRTCSVGSSSRSSIPQHRSRLHVRVMRQLRFWSRACPIACVPSSGASRGEIVDQNHNSYTIFLTFPLPATATIKMEPKKGGFFALVGSFLVLENTGSNFHPLLSARLEGVYSSYGKICQKNYPLSQIPCLFGRLI